MRPLERQWTLLVIKLRKKTESDNAKKCKCKSDNSEYESDKIKDSKAQMK